ncbi:hypothetical protein [Tsukamurella ocularis]|uniref:hypothetical protein n=1 Tax=Tsukamurella ocularis TaxID=1970234 RepID=UPI002166D11F|nr:hypothetical protein [Tsukamurella ocularis]MCS3780521.1 hypothetical protein [Tsukamurella ocularis]MCS3785924.1 hypothetical protein [Tsukamurella ocularis]MCS3849288.1 hypothetical protein [Tsukamurella ocularis]
MRSPGATDFGAGVCVGAGVGALGFAGVDGAPGPGFGVALGFTGVLGAPGFGDGAGVVGAPEASAGVRSAPDTSKVTTPIDPRRSTAPMRVPSVKVEPS